MFTDGACRGNPGPGGWGVVYFYNEHEQELSGDAQQTTNNRMELTSAIKALEYCDAQEGKQPSLKQIRIYTDSMYLNTYRIYNYVQFNQVQ